MYYYVKFCSDLITFNYILLLGIGPKTYFHVGTGKININFATMMQIVPYNDTCISNGTDFNCGCDRAQCPKWKIPAMGHNGIPKRDVILTIPGNVTFTDIEWLSLYCRRFKVSFGDITFRIGPTTVAPGNNSIIGLV